jgi:hypothetical protein
VIEAAEMVTSVIIFLLGIAVGRLRMRKRFKEPKPICGCRHHYSFHGEGGPCNKRWVGDEDRECGCQKYSGPTPLEQYTAAS